MNSITMGKVFDYRALRLLMGLIAFALPFVVTLIATKPLASISASYYSEARDAFVGMLFIVSAFLWAYNGHTKKQAVASKIASLAAILVAVCPTACDTCSTNIVSIIHYASAATLLSILAYFCLGPFREKTRGQTGKKGRRGKIYFLCGWVMILCMLAVVVANFVLSPETVKAMKIVYWAEAVAMCAFGVAWITAGKYLAPLVDKEDALHLFGK
jgi:hypothetical protein